MEHLAFFTLIWIAATCLPPSQGQRSLNPYSGHQPLHHNYYAPVHNHYEHPGPGSDYPATQGYQKDRVWRFMLGSNWGPYEYIDETDGYLKGFHPDLVKAVCAEAGKKCYWMMDTYTNCWDRTGLLELPGKGLAGGWYDACFGLLQTPQRLNSFNFSVPFSPQFKVALATMTGGNIGDISNKKIGFVSGWASSQVCLARQSEIPGAKSHKDVMFDTHDDMINGLKNGQVDAILTADAFDHTKLGLEVMEPWFYCTEGGASVMAPYGAEVIDWWNEAFTAFRANGGYRILCDVAKKLHGHRGPLFCLDDDTYS